MDGLHYIASRGMFGFGAGTVLGASIWVPPFTEWALWLTLGMTWMAIGLMLNWRS